MGNIMSGQELISRQENTQVYGRCIFFLNFHFMLGNECWFLKHLNSEIYSNDYICMYTKVKFLKQLEFF